MKFSYGSVNSGRNYILNKISKQKNISKNFKVIDIGGTAGGWSNNIVDLIVDINSNGISSVMSLDICKPSSWESIFNYVQANGLFDYAICTHTLEDIYNPFLVLDNLPKIAKGGIISMPSMYTELSRIENSAYLGYIHHRWIFEKDTDNSIVVLPKLVFLEKLMGTSHSPRVEFEEIRFEWTNTITYRVFMNNYLGPTAPEVVKQYNSFITMMLSNNYSKIQL